jgi:outer membrane lipoprotein SlyB
VDPQDAVGVGDGGPLGGLGVAALGGVGGQDLDGGVGAVGGDELDASGGDVQDRGDRGGGVELLHRALLCSLVVSDIGNATLPSPFRQQVCCMEASSTQVKPLISLQRL